MGIKSPKRRREQRTTLWTAKSLRLSREEEVPAEMKRKGPQDRRETYRESETR
jgi:hypothetical protein